MKRPSMKRADVLLTIAIAVWICCIFILSELHSYLATLQDGIIVTLLQFVVILAGAFSVFAIAPIQGWLGGKWHDMEQTEKYGKDHWLLSKKEKNMIDKILIEKHLSEEYGADAVIQEEAKRRVKEECAPK